MEKYMNFDGSQWENDGVDKQVFTGFDGSQWANDGIEKQVFTGFEGNNDTNQTTQLTEDEIVRVSQIYGTALNQSGPLNKEEIVRVTEIYGTALNQTGDGMSPNMELVLPENDTSRMPDSDVWSNHPGFLGITWSAKNREKKREQEEQSRVNANFPNSGSCSVMTDSLNRLNGELEDLYASSGGKKGARRVNARATITRERRLSSVQSGKDSACAGEEANFQRDALIYGQNSQGSTDTSGLSPLNIGIGVVLLGGIVYGITSMNK